MQHIAIEVSPWRSIDTIRRNLAGIYDSPTDKPAELAAEPADYIKFLGESGITYKIGVSGNWQQENFHMTRSLGAAATFARSMISHWGVSAVYLAFLSGKTELARIPAARIL